MEHLSAQLAAARAQGLCVRGMVVINPGNPTGQCLSKANQQDVVRFAEANNMIIIADEVYQVGGTRNTWSVTVIEGRQQTDVFPCLGGGYDGQKLM
jgi:aspartate/methionine/tyrosine aminotransferase